MCTKNLIHISHLAITVWHAVTVLERPFSWNRCRSLALPLMTSCIFSYANYFPWVSKPKTTMFFYRFLSQVDFNLIHRVFWNLITLWLSVNSCCNDLQGLIVILGIIKYNEPLVLKVILLLLLPIAVNYSQA